MQTNFTLLSLLFFCHYLGDYSHLTRPWMLKAKAKGSPVFPIFCHSLVHTVLMGFVLCFYNLDINLLLKVLGIQLVSHTLIDIGKGKLNRFEIIRNPTSQWHWITFGADQLGHFYIILYMVYLLGI